MSEILFLSFFINILVSWWFVKVSGKIFIDSNFHYMVPSLKVGTIERKSVFRGVCDVVIHQFDRKKYT